MQRRASPKEELFVRYYAESGNGVDAVKKAGFKSANDKSYSAIAYRLLRDQHVKIMLQATQKKITDKIEDEIIITKAQAVNAMAEILMDKSKRDNDRINACRAITNMLDDWAAIKKSEVMNVEDGPGTVARFLKEISQYNDEQEKPVIELTEYNEKPAIEASYSEIKTSINDNDKDDKEDK